MKTAKVTSAVDLFPKSYGLVRKNLNVYALVYSVPAALVVAGIIQLIADSRRDGWSWSRAFSSSILGPNFGNDSAVHTTGLIVAIVLFFGALIAYFLAIILNLRVAQGRSPTLGNLWQEYKRGWLWLRLIGLLVLGGLITLIGLIFLIVPGVIVLWRLFLAPYILIDKNTKIMDALSESWNMTKGYAWPIYSIMLFGFALSLTGIVPVVGGLISFALGVAYAVAPALRYQELK